MAKEMDPTRSLSNLLEAILAEHRKDIYAFSGGHLNEANLWVPPEKSTHQPWTSSQKQHINLREKSKIPRPSANKAYKEGMEKAITDFSMGTTGSLSLPPVKTKKDRYYRTQKAQADLKLLDEKQNLPKSADSYADRDDGILIEELRLPEVMLPTSRFYKNEIWIDPGTSENNDPYSHAKTKDQNLANFSKKFIPSHLSGVTKTDQYRKLKDFQSNVLHMEDGQEKHVLSGTKAVEHLEKKLQEELQFLNYEGYGPNFHRLQAYSKAFDSLITESTTFGYLLKTIKNEYDNYLAALLDTQTSRHHLLYNQVEKLSTSRSSNPKTFKKGQDRLHSLEVQAKDALRENARLRKEVEKATELAKCYKAPPAVSKKARSQDQPQLSLSEQVEELRAAILERMDQLNTIQQQLRERYVPTSVVSHLQQCVKETEGEIQKLMKQNEYWQQSINELNHDLEEAIDIADTTERDARRVWRRVRTPKAVYSSYTVQSGPHHYSSTYTATARVITPTSSSQYSDEETDSEGKWSWYIS